jgi:hypothetical protein
MLLHYVASQSNELNQPLTQHAGARLRSDPPWPGRSAMMITRHSPTR